MSKRAPWAEIKHWQHHMPSGVSNSLLATFSSFSAPGSFCCPGSQRLHPGSFSSPLLSLWLLLRLAWDDTELHRITACGGYSTNPPPQTNKQLGTPVREFYLIKSLEMGRPASNPDLRGGKPHHPSRSFEVGRPLIWTTHLCQEFI